MAKKKYQQPLVQTYYAPTVTILDGSAGATGNDVPWGSKRMFDLYDDSEEEDEDY